MIKFCPDYFINVVEFDKILALTKKYCMGEKGALAFVHPRFYTDKATIDIELDRVSECMAGIRNSDPLPLVSYYTLDEVLAMLRVEDSVLPEEEIMYIARMLICVQDIYKYFSGNKKTLYPSLFAMLEGLTFDDYPLRRIFNILDENGVVRSNASPLLVSLRRQIQSKGIEIDSEFRRLMNKYRQQGWLAESGESVRNGRRVLTVPAEKKRQIEGIIHDESSTGKMAYVEPSTMVILNNELFELEIEERKEIYRLLKLLCTEIRPYIPQIVQFEYIISEFDIRMAKGRFALDVNGTRIEVLDQPDIQWTQARHPLLYLRNKKSGQKTIPFDLNLRKGQRILLLSGPNAGGKSITMKSIGLLQLMVQSGYPVPANIHSKCGIFKKMFAGIGDHQSIEEDLSTYTSHLQLMKQILSDADADTLILLDEMGTGTDPSLGGAIAEGVLKKLNERGVYGVVTTHYSNLKNFGHHTEGFVNGSMVFDKEKLKPSYELRVGVPGSSYAFEIAKLVGLDADVIDYAKSKAGKYDQNIEQLLIDLQTEKSMLDEKLLKAIDKEKLLDKLVKNYESMFRELEVKRKRMRMDQKEQQYIAINKDHADLESAIREARQSLSVQRAQALSDKKRQEKLKLEEELSLIRKDIDHLQTKSSKTTGLKIEPGVQVRLKNGHVSGTIESIFKDTAVVAMGLMRMTLPLSDLEPIKEQLDIRHQKSIHLDVIKQKAAFDSKIDIRGLRPEEAMKTLEQFFDNALVTSVESLRILHGKGDGTLRRVVRQKIKEYGDFENVRYAEHDDGGDGVTLVDVR